MKELAGCKDFTFVHGGIWYEIYFVTEFLCFNLKLLTGKLLSQKCSTSKTVCQPLNYENLDIMYSFICGSCKGSAATGTSVPQLGRLHKAVYNFFSVFLSFYSVCHER